MIDASWWDDMLGVAWWKKLGFFMLCALSGLLFLPCLIPCFIRLISSVVEGMQLTAMAMNSKMAMASGAQKIMILQKQDNSELKEASLILNKLERLQKIQKKYNTYNASAN